MVKTLWDDKECVDYHLRLFRTDPLCHLVFPHLAAMMPPNADVLDWGCGVGQAREWLAKLRVRYASYLGVDISEVQIEAARRINPCPLARFKTVGEFEPGNFDVLLLTDALSMMDKEDGLGFKGCEFNKIFVVDKQIGWEDRRSAAPIASGGTLEAFYRSPKTVAGIFDAIWPGLFTLGRFLSTPHGDGLRNYFVMEMVRKEEG